MLKFVYTIGQVTICQCKMKCWKYEL